MVAYDDDGSGTTAVLMFCSLTQTYLLFSILPYAGYFALFLLRDGDGSSDIINNNNGDDEDEGLLLSLSLDTIGIYVGLLDAAFTFGRLLGYGPWRKLRTRYGEKISLLASLLLSALFSIAFGTSRSFSAAILSRLALGMSNGISGSLKRATINRARSKVNCSDGAIELSLGRILTTMSFGCAFGPGLSGYVSRYSLGYSSYPYLIPNLVGAGMCLISVALVWKVIGNDPRGDLRPSKIIDTNNGGGGGDSEPLLSAQKMKTKASSQMERLNAIWKARSTRSHLIGFIAFSFCIACVDEALPLFLIAPKGGLGMSPPMVGMVLAVAGIITWALQLTASLQVVTESLGLYPTLRTSAFLANVPMVLLPISLHIWNGGMHGASFAFAAVLFGIFRAFGFLYFNIIGILCNRTVPATYTDDASRIMTLVGLAARSLAPIVAGGILTTLPGHPWMSWSLIGMLSLFAAAINFALHCASGTGPWTASGQPAKSLETGEQQMRATVLSQRGRARVYTKLWEVHFDRGSGTVGAKWRKLARKTIAVNRFAGGSLVALEGTRNGIQLPASAPQSRRVSWSDRQLRPGVDADEVPFFILGTHKYDTSCQPNVLTPPLMDALYHHLPGYTFGDNYWLKYSLVRDGASLSTLESKVGFSKNTILAIETLEGHVFGCFMPILWRRRSRYEACGGQSFLWRMNRRRDFDDDDAPSSSDEQATLEKQASIEEDIETYHWTGDNEFCQLFDTDKLAVGGGSIDGGEGGSGFGFVIDEQLSRGSSSPCRTYGNPCLVPGSKHGIFQVSNVEVWALTPFLFEADAERSERSIHAREKSMTETPSSESPWSQFT